MTCPRATVGPTVPNHWLPWGQSLGSEPNTLYLPGRGDTVITKVVCPR